MDMPSSYDGPESTDPKSQLRQGLSPVQLKYVPIPASFTTPATQISMTASQDQQLPCRRCLVDARPGEVLHLISYDPFPDDSVTPYRGMGPIFVHAHDCRPFEGDKLPETQLKRLLAVRAYDEKHMMVATEVLEGSELEEVAGGMLADEKASYVNLYNAKPGCFAVRIERR